MSQGCTHCTRGQSPSGIHIFLSRSPFCDHLCSLKVVVWLVTSTGEDLLLAHVRVCVSACVYTGKTRLARALSGEIGSNFYCVSSSDLLSSWVGESEK